MRLFHLTFLVVSRFYRHKDISKPNMFMFTNSCNYRENFKS